MMALLFSPFVVNIIPKSLSGETNQDSEPHLTVNPANPQQIVGTAFTPPPIPGPNAPIFVSLDGGATWSLNNIIPSITGSARGTNDITTCFNSDGTQLYAAILRDDGTGKRRILEFLRTDNVSVGSTMTVLASRQKPDQPFVHATSSAGKDRVYIGNNDLGVAPKTQTLDQSLDAAIAAPSFTTLRVEQRTTSGQNGPQCRPVSHPDGTVYAAYYGWRSTTGNFNANTFQVTAADVVVIRDDNGGSGASPFTDLTDPSDGFAGIRVAQDVAFAFNRFGLPATGQQRIGGSISIAADPTDSDIVYLAWGDQQIDSFLTLHVRRSMDRGMTWSDDLLTVDRAANASLAVNSDGVVGLLCQQLTGSGGTQQWITRVSLGQGGAAPWDDLVLAQTSAVEPRVSFDPYLGDYDHLLAVGSDFYGIFSASNLPSRANFPSGVRYQRNADFDTARLLDLDNATPVSVSIDPFFFRLTFNG